MRKNKYDELEVDENQFEAEITITKENFYNNDWGVYRFETYTPLPKIDPEETMGGQPRYCATLAGNVQRLDIGQVYNATLTLDFNNKFKQWQFKPIIVNPCVPTSVASQQKFLCSILTVKQAQTLLEVYPNIVQDVIDGKADIDFSKLKGITANNWDSIRNKIIDNFVIADVLALLSPLGVTYAMIKKLVEFEGNPHLLKQKLNDNPYLLTQVKGLGFKKVDKLALQLNPKFLHSKMRGIAYIKYYLEEVGNDEGHTWIQNKLLKENYINNVPECAEYYDEILRQEYRNSMFLKVSDNLEEIGLKKNYDYEEYIAYKLAENNKHGVKHISEEIIQRGIDKANEFQGFEYDKEQVKIIYDIVNGSGVQILTGLGGCVDCDTEYFNGYQWKKICDYEVNDKVLQYNPDGTATLVKPLAYIKQPQNELYHFKTKYGLDQCLSLNHEVYYITSKGNLYHKTFEEVIKNHEERQDGFGGKFITTFKYSGTGIDLSDEEIRIMCAVICDGSLLKGGKTKHCRINIKKERKKERLRKLLDECNLEYKERSWNPKDEKYRNFTFQAPIKTKIFTKEWYNCTQHQLQVICDEILFWDGDCKNRFFSTVKENVDFIQFAFTSCGYKATIQKGERKGTYIKTINDKKYYRQSDNYTVAITKRNLVSIGGFHAGDVNKTKIEKYTTKDGYEYCFTVPSHILVLRRNDKIFITGNCGKSSISRGILNIFQEAGMTINTCALSARASIVIRESTGFQSSTIHRLLGYGFGGFFYNQNNNLITDVLMLDEASMVNISLFKSLVEAVPVTTKILIVGDGGQLPSIGCGNILNDLVDMNDNRICTINFLKRIYRQALKSAIITDANMIRGNKNPIPRFQKSIVHGELKDMFYMFFDNKDDVYKNALNLYYRSIESSGVDNVVITCPRRENALNSARTFNVDIQEHLLGEVKEQIKYGDLVYKKGCKIMQIENNYEKDIFNGEIGYITECNEKSIVAKFDQREIKYNKSELNQIDYAYAITIFKLQGGMCKNVIGVLDKSHFIMLNSSLLYTMITRASKKCCIFAEPFAFKTAVETSAIINRHTYLPTIDVDKKSDCLTKYKKVNIEKEDIVLPESDELPFN